MIETTILIGGIVRWLIKGCKTRLLDEIDGNLEPKWLKSYDTENYIIGLITCILIVAIVIFIVV